MAIPTAIAGVAVIPMPFDGLQTKKGQSVTSRQPIPDCNELQAYLECTDIIDWRTPEVRFMADVLTAGTTSDADKAKLLYEWVRDEVAHSADAGHETVTCRASEVLRHKTGICYAKAHLLSAMLRAVGIPSGLCYQVLRDGPPSERLVVHGLNGIYLESLGRWLRVDPRGNKSGVESQFSVDHEQLAFTVDPAQGEFTCQTVFARPVPVVVKCLTLHCSVTELMAHLPGSLDLCPAIGN